MKMTLKSLAAMRTENSRTMSTAPDAMEASVRPKRLTERLRQEGNQERYAGCKHGGYGEQILYTALCFRKVAAPQLFADDESHRAVDSLYRNIEEAAHRIADFINRQRIGAEKTIRLHIHGVAKAENGFVGNEGQHPFHNGLNKGTAPRSVISRKEPRKGCCVTTA